MLIAEQMTPTAVELVLEIRREIEVRYEEADQLRCRTIGPKSKQIWADPDTPARERKWLLAHLIEDVTLIKMPAEETTKIHVRFKGGKIQTLNIMSQNLPRSR